MNDWHRKDQLLAHSPGKQATSWVCVDEQFVVIQTERSLEQHADTLSMWSSGR